MSLRLRQVSRDFAGVRAVHALDVCIEPGQTVGLVGPNGSGKTTVVNLASGALPPDSGRIEVDGTDLTGAGPRRFAAAGVVRTFQGLRLFDGLSVLDNVLVGAQRGEQLTLRDAWLRTPAARRRERVRRGRARNALQTVRLVELVDRPVRELSHGQRRRVELARAIAARPRYLILDEPTAGLEPAAVQALADVITGLDAGILLVEHDTDLVSAVCDRVVYVAQGALAR